MTPERWKRVEELFHQARGRSPADLDASIRALADLELWSRGGSDYPEAVAFTLALRRAVGADELAAA